MAYLKHGVVSFRTMWRAVWKLIGNGGATSLAIKRVLLNLKSLDSMLLLLLLSQMQLDSFISFDQRACSGTINIRL